jgi:citrate synthase
VQGTRLLARHPDRPLTAKVERHTAVLLDAVGLPRRFFSPTFAIGRVAGWTAHVAEQARTGRWIRPQSRYVAARAASSAHLGEKGLGLSVDSPTCAVRRATFPRVEGGTWVAQSPA